MAFDRTLGFAINPALVLAAILTLLPLFLAAFARGIVARLEALSVPGRLLAPGALCLPYILVTSPLHSFRWVWLALYTFLPIAVSGLLWQARRTDIEQRGTWRDFLVLAALGLAVDLRWFERAWPPHLGAFNKMLLLDAGIYGFLLVRNLDGVGFDLRIRRKDITTGFREFCWYTPLAVVLGLGIGFLHIHKSSPAPLTLVFAFVFTFVFIAVPEELFFRGWMQNLLERRIGRFRATAVTSVLFGLAHFNKRALHFNWRYVVLAAIAGVFYGRAWRRDRRVAASALTHSLVDTVWSQWLR